jgi:hypothetical protein
MQSDNKSNLLVTFLVWSGKPLLLNGEEMGIINYKFYFLPNTFLPRFILGYITLIRIRGSSPNHNGRYQRTSRCP